MRVKPDTGSLLLTLGASTFITTAAIHSARQHNRGQQTPPNILATVSSPQHTQTQAHNPLQHTNACVTKYLSPVGQQLLAGWHRARVFFLLLTKHACCTSTISAGRPSPNNPLDNIPLQKWANPPLRTKSITHCLQSMSCAQKRKTQSRAGGGSLVGVVPSC